MNRKELVEILMNEEIGDTSEIVVAVEGNLYIIDHVAHGSEQDSSTILFTLLAEHTWYERNQTEQKDR